MHKASRTACSVLFAALAARRRFAGAAFAVVEGWRGAHEATRSHAQRRSAGPARGVRRLGARPVRQERRLPASRAVRFAKPTRDELLLECGLRCLRFKSSAEDSSSLLFPRFCPPGLLSFGGRTLGGRLLFFPPAVPKSRPAWPLAMLVRNKRLVVLTALAAACLSFPLSAGGTADSPVRLGSLALRGGSGRSGPEARGDCGADAMLVKAEQLFTAGATRTKNRPGKTVKTGSKWNSCLKAAAMLLFTGANVGQEQVSARADACLEEAAELFAATALQLKMERKIYAAGQALIRSGDCYARHTDQAFQAPAQYAEAARVLRQQFPDAAILALGKAADLRERTPGVGNLQIAGRLRRDQADLHEAAGNSSAVLQALEQAVQLFETDGAASAATACRLRIADTRVLRGEVSEASQIFEELSELALNAPSKAAGGMPCSLLRFLAGLCYLADGKPDQLEVALQNWEERDLSFAASDVHERLGVLLDAVLHADIDGFNKLVRALGETNQVVTALLTTIKQTVTREGNVGSRVAQSLAAQDDEDLL